MRLSRLCYDKHHRCPGWAGGGTRYPKGESRCDGGRIRIWSEETDDGMLRLWRWRFLRCDKCDVVTWPYVTRWLDRRYLDWKVHDARRWVEDRRELSYWD